MNELNVLYLTNMTTSELSVPFDSIMRFMYIKFKAI